MANRNHRTVSLPIAKGLNVVLTRDGLKILVDTTEAEKAAMRAVGQAGPRFEILIDDLEYLLDHPRAFVGEAYPNQAGTHTYRVSKDGAEVKIGFVVGQATYTRIYSTEALEGALVGVGFAEAVAANAVEKALAAHPAEVDEFAEGGDTAPGLPDGITVADVAAAVSSTAASAKVDPPAPEVVVAPPAAEPAPAERPSTTVEALANDLGVDKSKVVLALRKIGYTPKGGLRGPIPADKADQIIAILAQ